MNKLAYYKGYMEKEAGRLLDYAAPAMPLFGNITSGALKGDDLKSRLKGALGGGVGYLAGGVGGGLAGSGLGGIAGGAGGYLLGKALGGTGDQSMGIAAPLAVAGTLGGGLLGSYLGAAEGGHRLSSALTKKRKEKEIV